MQGNLQSSVFHNVPIWQESPQRYHPKESTNYLEVAPGEEEKSRAGSKERHDNNNGIDWKWIAIGGTVALVCGLHTGVVGKSLLLGVGQRIARRR